MNSVTTAFVLVNSFALLLLPRRWAPLPLLIGACYMTLGQGLDLGPFTFTVVRLLVLVGAIRVVLRGERLTNGIGRLDWVIVLWGAWMCAVSAFHADPETGIVFRFGMVYNALGFYFLLRVFCTSVDDVVRLCRAAAFLLVPVAFAMLYEHVTVHNAFSVFGGVPEIPQIREGHVRASGPFAHPILAGTVGAVSLPMMFGLWARHRLSALIGAGACLGMVLLSRSSGPVMSTGFAVLAVYMWRFRDRMRTFRWAAAVAYVVLDLVMKAPAYFLIARIDIAGGSTGWHRARLIESAIEHIDEWWLVGTDYTRHWMPTGVSWNVNHTDITNHYLQMGVLGGLPATLLFVCLVAVGFSYSGRIVRFGESLTGDQRFFIWTLGAALFAHVATCVSVSYFDQSVFFIYLTLAAIASNYQAVFATKTVAPTRRLQSPRPGAQPQAARRAALSMRRGKVPVTPGKLRDGRRPTAASPRHGDERPGRRISPVRRAGAEGGARS